MTKKTINTALSVMENSGMFKAAKPSEMLFGFTNPAEMYRAKYSSICFVDGEGTGEGEGEGETPPAGDDKPNDPPPSDDKKTDEPNGISDSEARLLKDVMKWKDKARNLETKVEEGSQSKTELAALRSLLGDVSDEELKELIAAKNDQERKEREARGEYDSIVDQMKTQHESDISAKDKIIGEKDDEIKSLSERINVLTKQTDDLTIGQQFTNSEYVKNRVSIGSQTVRQLFGEHFESEKGQIVAYDKPRGSEGRAPLVDGQANPLGFEAAIERLITSHPESKSLLRSTIKPGSGSRTFSQDVHDEGKKSATGVSKIKSALDKK